MKKNLYLLLLALLLALTCRWMIVATAPKEHASPVPGREVQTILADLADWLDGTERDPSKLLAIREQLKVCAEPGNFLSRAAQCFISERLGEEAPTFLSPDEKMKYHFLFGRGDAVTARILMSRTDTGRLPDSETLLSQLQGHSFASNRQPDWEVFLAPLDLRDRRVCDFGGGTGYLAWMIADKHAPRTLYLADIDPWVLEFVEFAARDPVFEALSRVRRVKVPRTLDKPLLPEPVDVLLMSEVHALRRPDFENWGRQLLTHLKQELQPGGILAIHELELDPSRTLSPAELEGFARHRLEECGYDLLLWRNPVRLPDQGLPGARRVVNLYARPRGSSAPSSPPRQHGADAAG